MTARTAFLHALPGHGFVPPEADVAALGAPALPVTPAQAALRFEAEARRFAAEFWALDPAARAERWNALAARATGGAAVWLRELKPGLKVVPLGHTDPRVAEVAGVVRRLFVLRPRVRADCRVRWLADEAARLPQLVRGARGLLRDDLPLARLEPSLFDWLNSGDAPERIERQTGVEARDRWQARRAWVDRWSRRALLAPAALLAVLLVVAVLTQGIRPAGRTHALSTAFGSRDPSPVAPVAPPVAPTGPFSGDEVFVFQSYERCRPTCPMPARYDEWVAAGRPRGVRTP
ncbi:hypothetical protein J0H58_34750 [bacterium]|nr:hypothetical protein [bacterium]